MSEGPRIPLERAAYVARVLTEQWAMDQHRTYVVGSVRRCLPTVGDLELLAPVPEDPKKDELYRQIARSVGGMGAGDGLFDDPPADRPIGRAIRGLKPGFLACSLMIRLIRPDAQGPLEVPVQVFRYEPDNLGWLQLYRTGPAEFGRWFLGRWKQRFNIRQGEERKGSIDGFLVDSFGKRVPVPTEADAFRIGGVQWRPPEERDEFMRALSAAHSGPPHRRR